MSEADAWTLAYRRATEIIDELGTSQDLGKFRDELDAGMNRKDQIFTLAEMLMRFRAEEQR